MPPPRDDEPVRARVGLREPVLRDVRDVRMDVLLRAGLLDRPRGAPLPPRGWRVSAEMV